MTHNEKEISERNGDDLAKGVVFYMKGKQIVGMLFWNLFGRMSVARRVLTIDYLWCIRGSPKVRFGEGEVERFPES